MAETGAASLGDLRLVGSASSRTFLTYRLFDPVGSAHDARVSKNTCVLLCLSAQLCRARQDTRTQVGPYFVDPKIVYGWYIDIELNN